ncbi:MAG: muramoyltetrapeptide carboxypeptidase [Microbacteriaceae bacterium]|nr:muramoyltetrapeptide carboxypeptidase [Microbacteriaceae bacterium]
MSPILRPKALQLGDVVAVAALSGGLDAEEALLFQRGVEQIERMGFAVQVSPLVDLSRSRWWTAAEPGGIADEFNRLLRDPQVRAIFALTGGRATVSYLDLIDYGAVRADPKPVLGFSDISALQLALHARTGLVTVHSDLVTHGFGYRHELDDLPRAQLEEAYRRVLTGAVAGPLPALGEWESWRPGRSDGPLVGGLLNRLVRLQGTPFALDADRFDGAILFWEEVGTSTSVIWNDLHVLRLAGVLDRIAGMVVGPTSTVERTEGGPDLRAVVLDVLGDRDIPVLGNVDIGHEPPNVPLPLGIRAGLDADGRTLELLEPAFDA